MPFVSTNFVKFIMGAHVVGSCTGANRSNGTPARAANNAAATARSTKLEGVQRSIHYDGNGKAANTHKSDRNRNWLS